MFVEEGVSERIWDQPIDGRRPRDQGACLGLFGGRYVPRQGASTSLFPRPPSTDHLPPLIFPPPIPLQPGFSPFQPCLGCVCSLLRITVH